MCVTVPRPPELVRRALDAEAAAQRRARCLRGAAINAALLLALTADLSQTCAGGAGPLHWVEAAAAGVAGANLVRLALALCRPPPPAPPLRAAQRRLLRLSHASFADSASPADASRHDVSTTLDESAASADELSLSLSPAREWRGGGGGAGGGAGAGGHSPPPGDASPPPRDRFFADRRQLRDYLEEYEARQTAAGVAGGAEGAAAWAGQTAAGAAGAGAGYQTAAGATGAAGAAGEEAPAALAAAARRLHLDPARLTDFHLNLRLWLHVTIVERVSRAAAEAEAALARAGLGGALEAWPADRLRALAAAPPRAALAPLAALLPFLEPFPRRDYAVRRVRAWAAAGALRDFRGPAGAADRRAADPTDAELLLHLFAAYMDAQLPDAAALRPFSSRYLTAAPAPPGPLGVHRARAAPPHYVLAWRGEPVEVARGRDNLLHTLLAFIAAAARAPPPAAPPRLPLGRHGLNMLWIIGRRDPDPACL